MARSRRERSREWLGIDLPWLRARIVDGLRQALRRSPLLLLIVLLQVLLFGFFAAQMRVHQRSEDTRVAPILVEFVSPPPPVDMPPPLPDLIPLRRRPTAVSRAPEVRAPSPPPSIAPTPQVEPLRARLFRPDGSINIDDDLMRDIERRVLADGVIEYRIADLDAAGHFRSRRALEYTETVFERFWVPNESLLEEWVRRGIHEVRIPIPGTTLHIRCVVSLVAPGGGCFGPFDAPQMAAHEVPVYDPPPNRNLLTQ